MRRKEMKVLSRGFAAGIALVVGGGVASVSAATCHGQTCSIVGTGGADILVGTGGADIICGLGGADTINGGNGNDTICGDSGNDVILGEGGADLVDGGAGSDTASYLVAVIASLVSGSANDGDTLVSIENLTGSNANDSLTGNSGNNTLDGQGGNDILDAREGNDIVRGGAGGDVLTGGLGADSLDGGSGTADQANYYVSILADLAAGTASDGDTLTGIERLTGSNFDDVLIGNSGANILKGGTGDDSLDGAGGTDTCDADGGGGDTCTIDCETMTGCEDVLFRPEEEGNGPASLAPPTRTTPQRDLDR